MSNTRKLLIVIPALLFILACQTLTRPLDKAKETAATAQSMVTEVVGVATEAGGFVTELAPVGTAVATDLVPVETAIASGTDIPGMPNFPSGNVLNPQGKPVDKWKDIPVMPQANAGQDFDTMYSFTVDATMPEVTKYYEDSLPKLGWEKLASVPSSNDATFIIFTKGNQTVSITVMAADKGMLVMINMQ